VTFFVNVLELQNMEERKMINKRVLIWRFTLVFMKSYAGTWQINRSSRNWRNQMTEQYRTIGPEIQGFLSDWRSFYRTCPSVRRYFVFTVIKSLPPPPPWEWLCPWWKANIPIKCSFLLFYKNPYLLPLRENDYVHVGRQIYQLD